MAITRAQQARQMLKKGSEPVVQGGVDNYLGKQPQVVVPRKWQSGPDKPPTELAYITEAEKKLLLKEDIHGSLKEGPNEGPGGVMSLDSFGDAGGGGQSGADFDADPGGAGSFTGATTPGGGGGGNNFPDPALPPGVKSGDSDVKTKDDETKAKKQAKEFLKSKNLKVGGGKKESFLDKLKKFSLPTQKLLYNVVGNKPVSEFRYISNLKYNNPNQDQNLDHKLFPQFL